MLFSTDTFSVQFPIVDEREMLLEGRRDLEDPREGKRERHMLRLRLPYTFRSEFSSHFESKDPIEIPNAKITH